MAGNGSAITLTLLLGLGMDANVANATNRIGVVMQTITSAASLRRTPRTIRNIRMSYYFIFPSILGSVMGAFVAVDTPPVLLKYIIGAIMIFILITLFVKPKSWLIQTDTSRPNHTWKNWLWFFAIGFYSGFIQMGMGILMLALLVLIARFSLRDANIIKLFIAFLLTTPAFFVFLWSGDIIWKPGIMLGIGSVTGAFIGTRYLLYHRRANELTRYLLIAVILFALVRIFFM